MSLRRIPEWRYWACAECGRLTTITRQQPTICPDCGADSWTPIKPTIEEADS